MKSIRTHLTRSLLLTLILVVGGGLGGIYWMVREEILESFDKTLLAKAQAISTLVVLDGGQVTLNFNEKFMRGFDHEEAKEFFEIWREDGTSVERSESLGSAHLPNRTGDFDHPKIWTLELPRNQPGRALGVEFTPRNSKKNSSKDNTGRLHLVVAVRSKGVNKDLGEILLITVAGGIVMVGLTALMVPLVLRRGLRPLARLADEVKKINAETLTLRFPTEGVPRELAVITERLNELLVRLEHSFERERRVSAAMAHELRTPIAELRNQAEIALKWPESRDPEADRDALAIARQMEAVVTHLLTLARSETGQLQPQLEVIDLAQAVAQAWKPFADLAKKKNCRPDFTLSSLHVRADPVLVRSILGNLLENAVEYSPAGSAVSAVLRPAAGGFVLEISNPAPELTAADVARFFERFWRKDAARSGGLHAGLGLSLVQEFVRALGWEIELKLATDKRLVVVVSASAIP